MSWDRTLGKYNEPPLGNGMTVQMVHHCQCGAKLVWPDMVDHVCPWTKQDPDDVACDECEAYVCQCQAVAS